MKKLSYWTDGARSETAYYLTVTEATLEATQDKNGYLRDHCIKHARQLPNGWIKKFARTCLDHNIDFYSPRPYIQGYGCDGNTGACICLIAEVFCQRIGLDFAALYAEAYPDEEPWQWAEGEQEQAMSETFIPREIDPVLVIEDLEQINYHSLVGKLLPIFQDRGLFPKKWPTIDEIHTRQQSAMQVYKNTFDPPTPSVTQLSMFKETIYA